MLRNLCDKLGYEERMYIPKMIQILYQTEVINGITRDLISQVSKIANRGVHGEIVSNEYIEFVKESYPEIKRQLKEADNALTYMTCPRCRYSGYSKYENVCPQCGKICCD